jgi:hypothetical protein
VGLTPDGETFRTEGSAVEHLEQIRERGAVVAVRRTTEQKIVRVVDTPEAIHLRYQVLR